MAKSFWTTLSASLAVFSLALAVLVLVAVQGQASAVSSALHQTAQLSQIASVVVR